MTGRYELPIASCFGADEDDPRHIWFTLGIGGGHREIHRHQRCGNCRRTRATTTVIANPAPAPVARLAAARR